jgi:hypothetical protein
VLLLLLAQRKWITSQLPMHLMQPITLRTTLTLQNLAAEIMITMPVFHQSPSRHELSRAHERRTKVQNVDLRCCRRLST